MLRQDCSAGVGKATAQHPSGRAWEDWRQQISSGPAESSGASLGDPSGTPLAMADPSPPADVSDQTSPRIILDGEEPPQLALLSQPRRAGTLRGFVSN